MVIDFLPGSEPGSYIRNAGGAPANVAIAIARNGLKAGFIGKVGADDFGDFLQKTLLDNNVEIPCAMRTDKAVTTMAFVTLGENGERSFTFARKPGADMLLEESDIDPEVVKNAIIVHAGSCSLSRFPAANATTHALRLANQEHRMVSFDVNYRNLLWDDRHEEAKQRIHSILKYVDLLKISDEELFLFGGEDKIPALMSEYQISLVVLTLGKDGARCLFDGKIIDVPGRPTKAIDTTGAGDAFWGAFLSSLIYQHVKSSADLSYEIIAKAMKWGTIAGSLCVASKGAIASLPTKQQIESQLALAE